MSDTTQKKNWALNFLELPPEQVFKSRLLDAMDGLQTMLTLGKDIPKAANALVALKKALGDMATAAKIADFDTANTALTAAEAAAQTVSNERVAADLARNAAPPPPPKPANAPPPASEAFNRRLAAARDGLQAMRTMPPATDSAATAKTALESALLAMATAAQGADFDAADIWATAAQGADFDAADIWLTAAQAAAKIVSDERVAADVAAEVAEALVELTAQVNRSKAAGHASMKLGEAPKKLWKRYDEATNKTDPATRLKELLAVKQEVDEMVRLAGDAIKTMAYLRVASGGSELRDKAQAEIKKLPEGATWQALQERLAEWDDAKNTADAQQDLTKRLAALVKLDDDARKLLDDALTAGGGDVAVRKQAAYQVALEKSYGIAIDVSSGMTNTHFDRVYDMFGKLPVEHTRTEKMKNLTYTQKPNEASYGHATIVMGNFGDASQSWGYKEPQNGFNISTLHEVGHSVDDKYRLMTKNASPSCGGWQEETLETVTAAFVDSYTGKKFANLDRCVGTALSTGNSPSPTDLKGCGDLTNILAVVDQCFKIRVGKTPWKKEQTVTIGERSYHESYPGKWVSYLAASRSGMEEVRDYQWRAPGEWFAELYAWTWMRQEVAPGVDKKVAAYMWTPAK